MEQAEMTKKQLREARRVCKTCGQVKYIHPWEACRTFKGYKRKR